MWPWIGVGLAAIGVLLGVRNARSRKPNAFAREVYGMTTRSHGRFAAASAAFAVSFAASAFARPLVLPLLAVYVLLFVLYATSFARGSSEA